ncbi:MULTISPECIES: gamma-glutamyltransferase [unclassified Rathayibacter]|uniref:gamma-glutamyltransferase n=1 Tax=unclassified Rathayibacter TaxID=2609250 RepID=UPI000F4C9EB6|nr:MULTISPECIES: gamma-glutamyltransferase [unclassified Rathayibacter]ROP48456.1 gamma-glutamyltranspeptidase/glutathione hydrolase [Rathayibacter sp. PhB186]ROS49286.1 gamma-glutamyltranspeptidase/glutathione hydrolase [Rathayibacter sp. PhB185]
MATIRSLRRAALALVAVASLGVAGAAPAAALDWPFPGVPSSGLPSAQELRDALGGPVVSPSTSVGYGGAVSSVDALASRVGLEVLKRGGNAADAAVATASALGVTEPYSAGIGGGGYFVYFDAKTGEVSTIDGRETAPAGITPDAFLDPATGAPYPFTPQLVSSGVAVGVPGTVATWDAAVDRFGTLPLPVVLAPSIVLAAKGFPVDETFRSQTLDNLQRFQQFPDTAELFLPGGDAPAVGSTFRNPDLAKTLARIAARGPSAFYDGPLAAEIADTVQNPRLAEGATLPAPAGSMTEDDLAGYSVAEQAPTHTSYRGLDVYGMAPSSSGGIAIGEALNILENHDLAAEDTGSALHLYLEASARAFADRGAYVGDPAFVDVPTETLLSQEFADSRDCTIDPAAASTRPVAPGALDGVGCATALTAEQPDTENVSTTHLSVVDKWGNAASYTLTIEQTGGSAMTVPGRGFLLNNELTDFSATPVEGDPNRIEPGKRPRSSMSPTIVLEDGAVKFVVGSPGGATIITTVLQTLVNRIDLGMTLPEAVAAPRASQRNTASTSAEPGFIEAYADDLAPFGQQLTPSGDTFTSAAQIGAVAAIEVDPSGLMTAAAEPVRRGGGVGLVVTPEK